MAVKKLSVKMFGGFTARYGDEVLTFGRQRNSKFSQLFQILMTRPGQGFSKEDIAKSLYAEEEVEDLNASLNNTIFRLRKYLRESPLPSGDYLLLDGGIVWFGGAIETVSDVWSFENMAREFTEEQDSQKKADICKNACGLYQGEFLPQLSNEQWVIEKSGNYQRLYSKMLKYLLGYLKGEGDYGNVERTAARAARLSPDEGWEIWQVDSMVTLGQYKEAAKIYQKIERRAQETGDFLSKKQQEQLREIGVRMRQPEGQKEDISRWLVETAPGEGAYACSISGFLDCFRMLRRVIARDEELCFGLYLCTILGTNGNPLKGRNSCERQSERLCETFGQCLRRGDIYARYSDGQYLLLCMGARKENISEIGERIDVNFRKCGGRGGIRCSLLDDGII